MARGPEHRRKIVKLTSVEGATFTMTEELKASGSFGRSFIVVFADAAMKLATDASAPGDASRVFLWALSGGLSHQQWRTISQVEVGKVLGVSNGTVSKCLAYLRDAGMIERVGAGPRQQWRLTEGGSWRGTTGQYHRRKRETFAVIEGGRDIAGEIEAELDAIERGE